MIDDQADIELLTAGDVEIEGRMPWSSNVTLLCTINHGDRVERGVYKPRQGERPLWDFPPGLDRREVAAFELSRTLGWDLVPPTVLRDGPLGPGSLQLFMPADFEQHYFTLLEDDAYHDALKAISAFDLVANNTDRKAGHCLLAEDGHVWAIDNGLSFHHEFKLRTVIWDFAGEPLPGAMVRDLEKLADDDPLEALCALLDPFEVDAVRSRARALARLGEFPQDDSGHRHPWPLV